jgi:hypothetical protein
VNKKEEITIVILSEPEAKEVSVRYALRCIGRDFSSLFRALWRHIKRFFKTVSDGWIYTNCWWTRKR